MRYFVLLVLFASFIMPVQAQDDSDGPSNEKARKTYKQGLDYIHQRVTESAIESFKKADKQDDGHCSACQKKMIKYGMELGEWKTAEIAGEEMVVAAQGARNQALAHYQLGTVPE